MAVNSQRSGRVLGTLRCMMSWSSCILLVFALLPKLHLASDIEVQGFDAALRLDDVTIQHAAANALDIDGSVNVASLQINNEPIGRSFAFVSDGDTASASNGIVNLQTVLGQKGAAILPNTITGTFVLQGGANGRSFLMTAALRCISFSAAGDCRWYWRVNGAITGTKGIDYSASNTNLHGAAPLSRAFTNVPANTNYTAHVYMYANSGSPDLEGPISWATIEEI